jgi:hypothetical protein
VLIRQFCRLSSCARRFKKKDDAEHIIPVPSHGGNVNRMQRCGSAQVGVIGAPDRSRLPCPVLVGLGAPDGQHDTLAIDKLDVAGVEPDDLGMPPKPASRMARLRIAGIIGVAWQAGRVPLRRRMPSISRAMLGRPGSSDSPTER